MTDEANPTELLPKRSGSEHGGAPIQTSMCAQNPHGHSMKDKNYMMRSGGAEAEED